MATYLYAYNPESQGGKDLADELGILRIRHDRSRFVGGPRKTVINWGASTLPDNIDGSIIINKPQNIRLVANKLEFFKLMSDENVGDIPRVPEWTTDRNVALNWVTEGPVVARKILNGHSAAGLVIMDRNDPDSLVNAPLYTKYVPKKDEYRVHILRGEVIDIQRKALKADIDREEANWKVRNLANGFIFARNEDRDVPQDVKDQALKAMAISGLDFGAVDVIYQAKANQAFVLEINSAPGLSGTTLTNYANAFKKII